MLSVLVFIFLSFYVFAAKGNIIYTCGLSYPTVCATEIYSGYVDGFDFAGTIVPGHPLRGIAQSCPTPTSDKYLHFSFSFTIQSVLNCAAGKITGTALTAGIGIGKELRDLITGKGSAEWGDLIADFAGITGFYAYESELDYSPLFAFCFGF